jgi:hypothetical protein
VDVLFAQQWIGLNQAFQTHGHVPHLGLQRIPHEHVRQPFGIRVQAPYAHLLELQAQKTWAGAGVLGDGWRHFFLFA